MSRGRLRSAAAAAVAARLSYGLLRAVPPGGEQKWTRTNHRGDPITLLEGPAVAAGGIVGAALADVPGREKVALMLAGTGAATFGGYDDLAGDGSSRGFRGHLGALRHGEVTTGAVKIAGIGATGLAAAIAAGSPTGQRHTAADTLINAGLIAGSANLLNLFDLRPGRAIKVATVAAGLLAALPGDGGEACAAPLAAAIALLPEDLGERSMLGDAGANALGAMLGVAATRMPRVARIAALAGVAGLTAASEVVSFSRVIEQNGPLRWLDMLGRRAPTSVSQPARAGNGTDTASQDDEAQAPSSAPGAGHPAGSR